MQERKMSKKEKAKEKRLKDKYDDSGMKAAMKKQYGKDWENVYYATIRKQAMEEGYQILPPINRDRYTEIQGMEGPFMTRSGKVVYYDPKQGAYYDRDTDMYLTYDEWKALDNDRRGIEDERDIDVKESADEFSDLIADANEMADEAGLIGDINYGETEQAHEMFAAGDIKGAAKFIVKSFTGVKNNVEGAKEIYRHLVKSMEALSSQGMKENDLRLPASTAGFRSGIRFRSGGKASGPVDQKTYDQEMAAFRQSLTAPKPKVPNMLKGPRTEGHSPHPKGSAKYKKHMAAMHAGMNEEMTDDEIDAFHRALDTVIHKHIGHSSDEKKQSKMNEVDDTYGSEIDRIVARVLGNAKAQQSGAPTTSPRPRLRPDNFPTIDLTPDAEAGDQVHIRPTPKPMPRPRLRPQNIGSNPRTGATRGIDPRDNYSPEDLQRLLNQPGMRSESNINELEIPGTDYSIPDAAVAAAAAIRPPNAPKNQPARPSSRNVARRANARGMSLVSDRPTAATSRPTGNLSAVQTARPSWGTRALGALGRLASRASLPAMILTPKQMGDGTLSPEMQAELERLEAERRRSMGEMRESLQFNEDDNNSISDNETVAIYVRTMLDESHNTWDKVKEQVQFVLSVLDENHTANAETVFALLRNRNLQESIDKQMMLKENVDTLKKIVADKSVMPVKFDDGSMRVDLTTASLFLSVYDKQKPETQEKMQKMMKTKAGFVKLLEIIYSKSESVQEAHPNSKVYDKCWDGYEKVPGKKRGEPDSCRKKKD